MSRSLRSPKSSPPWPTSLTSSAPRSRSIPAHGPRAPKTSRALCANSWRTPISGISRGNSAPACACFATDGRSLKIRRPPPMQVTPIANVTRTFATRPLDASPVGDSSASAPRFGFARDPPHARSTRPTGLWSNARRHESLGALMQARGCSPWPSPELRLGSRRPASGAPPRLRAPLLPPRCTRRARPPPTWPPSPLSRIPPRVRPQRSARAPPGGSTHPRGVEPVDHRAAPRHGSK